MTMDDNKQPIRKDLKRNKILPIYENWKEKKKLLGYARLLKRVQSRQEELPYVYKEIGSDFNREPHAYIYSHQRWRIEYVDPYEYDSKMSSEHRWKYIHQKGFTTTWNIAFFITVSSIYPSGTEDW